MAKAKPFQHKLSTGEFILVDKVKDNDYREALLIGIEELIKQGKIKLKDIQAKTGN